VIIYTAVYSYLKRTSFYCVKHMIVLHGLNETLFLGCERSFRLFILNGVMMNDKFKVSLSKNSEERYCLINK
jgi:hypothetical protein